MVLQLTNTLGGKKEVFEPLEAGKARLYGCGPTVKEPVHLGKFRSFLLADVLRRHLEYSGLSVTQVMNITDVGHLNEFEEDAVEIAAARSGLHAWELVEKEEKAFHEVRHALHIRDCHHYPHAREHIEDMIALVQDLETKGLTYKAGGNIYLDVHKVSDFGRLAGESIQALEARVSTTDAPPHSEKRSRLDIDLWRTDLAHSSHWPSPWGRGFPGWHVECVAMSRKYLGEFFDLHTGSHENIFPHHDCEIAQAVALSGKPQAGWWLHSGPVRVDGKPMSLENDNVVKVRELLASGFRGSVLRVALLGAPYREQLDFGEGLLEQARNRVNAVLGFHEYVRGEAGTAVPGENPPPRWIEETEERFRAALDNDLDYSAALDALTEQVDRLEPGAIGEPAQALKALERWDQVLGILD